eukprot:COSAG06_NODE_2456_length_6848_cov_66.970959_8_plen_89_part_00
MSAADSSRQKKNPADASFWGGGSEASAAGGDGDGDGGGGGGEGGELLQAGGAFRFEPFLRFERFIGAFRRLVLAVLFNRFVITVLFVS